MNLLTIEAPRAIAVYSMTVLEGATFPPHVSYETEAEQYGVTFSFSEEKTIGQYANGDWWVLGPVNITQISPESTEHDGLNGDGSAYTDRVVHGTMINPGNRSFAVDDLVANNTTNTVQGWDSIVSSKPQVAYDADANVDPGKTGVDLVVSEGSIVKFVSKLTGLPNGAENRPAGTDMVVFTVVDEIPAHDAIRPGVSRTDKTSPCRRSDFNLNVFNNFTPTASAPTYAQALDWVDRYIEASLPDSINNPVAKGANNHPEYGRDIGNNLHRALLCLHLNFTDEQKLNLLCHMAAIADDLVSRAEEGSVTLGGGGGNQWKKPIIVVCAAALGDAAPASWLTWLSNANKNVWAEDSQIFTVSGLDIALPRYTADGRPRDPYTYGMFGSAEWGEAASYQKERSGSNWNAAYRDTVSYSVLPGALAVELTEGGKDLWDHDEFWLYYDTVFLRRDEGGPGNTLLAFPMEMIEAHRPAKVATPTIVDAGVKDDEIYIRFDQALDELADLPATTDFVVNVNASPVSVSSVDVWRQNVGLVLAAPVSGNDTVTIDYTSGSNKVKSVDGVDVANFSGQAVTNNTDKVGGPNAAYPVVRFTPGVQRQMAAPYKIAAADNPEGTCMLRINFDELPASDKELFGNTSGSTPFRLIWRFNGTLELRVRNAAGAYVIRAYTPVLSAGVDYEIVWSWDVTENTSAAGINCYINGSPVTLTHSAWGGGAGVTCGYNTLAGVYTWNHSNDLTFDLGGFWLCATERVDLASDIGLFSSITSGNLDILTLGNGITGVQPDQFHVGNDDQWNDGAGINRGTTNKMFIKSGIVQHVSGSEWI